MRIGIFLDNWEKQDGGGHSYSEAVIEYFSSVVSNHEFLFIVKSISDDSVEVNNSPNNYIKYNPFTKTNTEQQITNRELGSLNRYLDWLNFFVKRLKMSSAIYFRNRIEQKITNLSRPKRDPTVFKKLMQDRNIQCVYYPTAFACEDYDVPFYATIWDLGHLTISVFPEVSGNGEYESRQNFFSSIVHRSYRIVSESESGKSDICKYYNLNPGKIVVVPQFPSSLVHLNPSDSNVKMILDKFRIDGRKFLFYPAQFWPHKNHVNLIKAIDELKRKNILIELVFTGSDKGNLAYILDYIENLKLGDQIKYLGFVSDEEMRVLYNTAYAMVFPTLLGPTNMPISEAIACGCPVICSDFTGHREQAEDAALYVNPEEYLDISEKIETIIRDDELRLKLIARGIEVSKKNTVQHVFKDLLGSFDEFEKIRVCWKN
jgi:glycosyltransferase involved in cell wall biosynthesis